MAYTLLDEYGDPKPIRLIVGDMSDKPKIGQEFTPCWWVCDPCAHSSRRYEITFRADMKPQGYPWYQVVTSDDEPANVEFKMAHYAKVIAARHAADDAQREYERLNGGR